MITVYVPISYLKQIKGSELPRPEMFWLTKPDSWSMQDLGTMMVSPETLASWNTKINDSKLSSKQLLKD